MPPSAPSAPRTRDRLFLLQPGFADPAATAGVFYCIECAALEGVLGLHPHLLEQIDVERIAFPRPRARLVELIGEANQGCPVLVLASDADASLPGVKRSEATGALFVAGAVDIGEYFAVRYQLPRPHP